MHIFGPSYIRTLSVLFIYVYCSYLLNYSLCKLHRNSVTFKNHLFENLFFSVEEYSILLLPYSISLCNVADLPHQSTVQRQLDREGGKKSSLWRTVNLRATYFQNS